MKPQVFVGSSVKGLRVAELIQANLKHDAEAVLWSQAVFSTTNVPIEDLTAAVERFDFAVFVLDPEDLTKARDEEAYAVRDNVIFELGLFLGRLGRSRTYFIAPSLPATVRWRLPTDLSGLTPAQYDPEATNLHAAVGSSLLDLKNAIRTFAKHLSSGTILYETGSSLRPYDFVSRGGYFWDGKKRISPQGTGEIKYLDQGVMKVTRTNQVGRFEIELRQEGEDAPSIARRQTPPRRILRISCEARVDAGEHVVRFVLKDIKKGKWANTEKRTIANTDWEPIDVYLAVSPTIDLLFRIDDETPTISPSSLYLRHLVIEEATR